MQFYTQEIEKKFGLDITSQKLLDFDKDIFDEILTEFPRSEERRVGKECA